MRELRHVLDLWITTVSFLRIGYMSQEKWFLRLCVSSSCYYRAWPQARKWRFIKNEQYFRLKRSCGAHWEYNHRLCCFVPWFSWKGQDPEAFPVSRQVSVNFFTGVLTEPIARPELMLAEVENGPPLTRGATGCRNGSIVLNLVVWWRTC